MAKAQAKSAKAQGKRGRAEKKAATEEASDRLQLDESAAVKKLLQAAKERGSVTYDETRRCRRTRSAPSRSKTSWPRSPRWA